MIKNILFNWSHTFVSALAVFLLYPFFTNVVGTEQYGVWLLIASITGFFSLIQLGVPLANVRYVSKYYARGDYKKLNEILGTNLFLFSFMAALTLPVGCFLALILDKIFQIPPQYVRLAKLAMLLASLEVSVRFVFEAVEGVLHARQEFVVINSVKNFMVFCRVGCSFWLVSKEYGLVWIASLLLLTALIQSLLLYGYVKRKYPQLHFIPRVASKSVLIEIFGYSGFVLLLQVSSRISFRTDALVLASVVSVASVVWFGVANSMLLYLTKLAVGVSNVLMPRISELDALGETAVIRQHYLRVVRLTGLMVFPVCLALHLYGGDFIRLWMGDEFNVVSVQILSILALGYAFFLVQRGAGFPVLMGTSKMKIPTVMMFVAALTNLILSVWWGKVYGVIGVAWGTTFPTLLVAFFLMYYVAMLLGIRLITALYQSLLVPIVGLVPLYLGYLVAEKLVSIPAFSGLFLRAVIAGGFYMFFAYFLLDKLSQRRLRLFFSKRTYGGSRKLDNVLSSESPKLKGVEHEQQKKAV